MAAVRIRWRGVARAAAIIAVGLIALRVVPGLLRAPEPPPLGDDVGLPQAISVPVVPTKPRGTHRRTVPDAPAASARIGTGTRHRRRLHHRRAHPSRAHEPAAEAKPPPPPEPVESAPPPAPEYVPAPAPEAAPEPLPAPPPEPRSTPGDGSEEFTPH